MHVAHLSKIELLPIEWLCALRFVSNWLNQAADTALDCGKGGRIGGDILEALLERLGWSAHPREQHQNRDEHRKWQCKHSYADEEQQGGSHRASEEAKRSSAREIADELHRLQLCGVKAHSVFAEELRDRSLRKRGLESGMHTKARAGALPLC